MVALMRSRCGLVEIDPTNDHTVLQVLSSRQVHSGDLKVCMYVQIELSEQGKVSSLERDNLTKNNKQMNRC